MKFITYIGIVLILSFLSSCIKQCDSSSANNVVLFFSAPAGFSVNRVQGVGNERVVPESAFLNDRVTLDLSLNGNKTSYVIQHDSFTDTISFNTHTITRYQGKQCGYTVDASINSLQFTKYGIDTMYIEYVNPRHSPYPKGTTPVTVVFR